MSNGQRKIVISWGILLVTSLGVFFAYGNHLQVTVIFLVGYLLYRYCRRGLQKDAVRTLQVVGYKWKMFSVIYYFVLAGCTYTLAFLHPELLTYDLAQVVGLVVLFMLPLIPTAIGKEIALYKMLCNQKQE